MVKNGVTIIISLLLQNTLAIFQMAHQNHYVGLRIEGVVFLPLITGLSVQILARQNRVAFPEQVCEM